MISNDCSSEAFVEGRKDTLRVETLTTKAFARKTNAQFQTCKKCEKFCEKKIFHVYRLKKLAKDKKWKEMAKLEKVSTVRQTADLQHFVFNHVNEADSRVH